MREGPFVRAARSSVPTSPAVIFEGACDASGAVPIDAHRFAVADDEDNVLRIYDADRGGAPLHAVDVSPDLRAPHKKKKKKSGPEADLEAATRLGDTALWLSSHARNKKGKEKEARLRYFGTSIPRVGEPVHLRGAAYSGLLADLLASPELAGMRLHEAAARPPQAEGGLNIEGMTAMPDGRVLLGFRNPTPGARAILVALENPLDPLEGEPARFGSPVRLDLGGMGVRGLSYWRGSYLIVAGHRDDGGRPRLYAWRGPGALAHELAQTVPAHFNPEAFFTPEDRDELMLLSDDGSREIDGVRCKDLEDSAQKRFRGAWLRLEPRRLAATP